MAFVDPTNVVNFSTGEVKRDMTEDDRAVLAGVKIKDTDKGIEREVKLTDKTKALELLGKHLGLFDQQQDSGGTAIAEFLKALHPTPGDLAALYAHEEDDGTEE